MNVKIEELYKWMQEKGIKSKIQVRESFGLGLFTKAAKGETVLSVPRELVITRSNTLKFFESCPTTFSKLPFMLSENSQEAQRLVILMYLTHILYNKNPYSALLPQEINAPIGWDTESIEYKLLEATGLDLAIRSKKVVLENLYDGLDLQMGLDVFMLCDHLFVSRSMSLVETEEDKKNQEDWVGIIPILDFCNHSFAPNANWEIKKDSVDLILLEDVDGEIFISYGPKPNNELLFIHGFTIDDNAVKLVSPAPFVEHDDDDVTIYDKMEIIERKGWGTRVEIGKYDPQHQENILDNVPIEIQMLLSGMMDFNSLQLMSLCALRKDDGFQKRGDKFYFKDEEQSFATVPYIRETLIKFIVGWMDYFLQILGNELDDSIELTPVVKMVYQFRLDLAYMLEFNIAIFHDTFLNDNQEPENKEEIETLKNLLEGANVTLNNPLSGNHLEADNEIMRKLEKQLCALKAEKKSDSTIISDNEDQDIASKLSDKVESIVLDSEDAATLKE
ncbi:hypothetical protein HDV06_005753 [Boothiomyces sp. JEL0866]|nr:hypothetical protein HDV06_005753 [Boothiomyces sp. JEL0866]